MVLLHNIDTRVILLATPFATDPPDLFKNASSFHDLHVLEEMETSVLSTFNVGTSHLLH